MEMRSFTWSKTEKTLARKAFDEAYRRECEVLAEKVRTMAAQISEPQDIWRIHDLLEEQRSSTDDKYDYRYSVLIFVFARLIREGWLSPDDLAGLGQEKLDAINHLASPQW